MRRSVLIHGRDRTRVCRLGREVAVRLGAEVLDGFEGGRGWEWLLAHEGPSVGCLPSEWLLDRERRVEVLGTHTIVAVDPGVATGVGTGGVAPDLLDGLLKAGFHEAHAVCGASEPLDASVERICSLAEAAPVAVALGESSYSVDVSRKNVDRAIDSMEFGSAVMLHLTDANVQRLHGDRVTRALERSGLRIVRHVLQPGEERKCLATLGEIYDVALAGGIDRSSWVVAVGGGVTTDIAGLVAATWMRGIRWLGIPTTLLAMVDASVGGKTAVDHGAGKNAVGAFWHPARVVCDVGFIETESSRNYVGALSEVVKTAVIGDEGLFELLEAERARVVEREQDLMAEVVERCVRVKARVVGLDPREKGLRAVLNFGHTVGHALEVVGGYERYSHGEAVALGTAIALRLGKRLGFTPPDVAERIEALLVGLGLPVRVGREELVACTGVLGHDKKRAGSAIRFVFARDIGNVSIERIGLEDLRELVCSLD